MSESIRRVGLAVLIVLTMFAVAVPVGAESTDPMATAAQSLDASENATVLSSTYDDVAVESITTLVTDVGGRVDWLENSDLIAYDSQNANGWFDVWTMQSDGSQQTCLTCDNDAVPSLHKGNPVWHPSGDYILFQALNEKSAGPFSGTRLFRIYTNPGAGVRNDLWVMSADGQQAWQMMRSPWNGGVLHPHFSHDGSRVIWAQMISTSPGPMGSWVIRMADFITTNGIPSFRNVRTLTPGGYQWYETHGFSPDDSQFLFTAMPVDGTGNDFDLYAFDLERETITPLTPDMPDTWDEHSHFMPDGDSIIWMSSRDTLEGVPLSQVSVKTEYWLMDADGQNPRQITSFNDRDSAHYRGGRVIASDVSVSSDGMRLVAYLQVDPTVDRPGDIVLIQLMPQSLKTLGRVGVAGR